jgi:hypothetical protein
VCVCLFVWHLELFEKGVMYVEFIRDKNNLYFRLFESLEYQNMRNLVELYEAG